MGSKLCDETAKLSVMVVDDDADHLWLAGEAMADSRIVREIYQATTAEEALETIAAPAGRGRAVPDVMFLDIEMPGMGGMGLLEKIKSDPQLRHITVIVVSGHSEIDLCRAEALKKGADDFVEKSMDVLEMTRNLQQTLRRCAAMKGRGYTPEDARG